ncbi:carbohydrate ABC transporter permease [Streptosporangium sp. CA-135522]|uniref:carbohydrate ABC transporter permease n=1 Tax=Streptosporangium sp. CA-135522 TaxID=3240072 RepID=UPI003D8F1959
MTGSLRRWSALFLVPALALYLFVVIVPSISVVNFGFFDWSAGLAARPAGLANYREMFTDPAFIDALWHTFLLLIGAMVVQIPLGFLFALLIHRRYPGSGFFQAVYFIPVVLSTVVIGVLWSQVYQPQHGLLNAALEWLGLDGWTHAWLGETGTALMSVVVVVGWQYVGLYMLIFLAAMQAIPKPIYEAGELDGAVGWRRTVSLTIPMLFDTVKLSVILVVTGSVQYFNLIWAMTKGGPANSSSVLASYMYVKAFQDNRLGFASAVATFMLLLNLVLALGLQRAFRRTPLELG